MRLEGDSPIAMRYTMMAKDVNRTVVIKPTIFSSISEEAIPRTKPEKIDVNANPITSARK